MWSSDQCISIPACLSIQAEVVYHFLISTKHKIDGIVFAGVEVFVACDK